MFNDTYSNIRDLVRFSTPVDSIFSSAVNRWPNRNFLEWSDGVMTYAQLDSCATAIARALLVRGVGRGDRVAVWMSNIWEWVAVQFAVTKIGAVLTPINTRLRRDDLNQILTDSGAKVLFTQFDSNGFSYLDVLDDVYSLPDALPALETVIVARPNKSMACRYMAWDKFISEGSLCNLPLQPELNVDRLAYILYTSGTSSEPKGVMLSHRNLNNCFNMLWDFRDGEKSFLVYPLFAITGCHNAVLGTALVGGSLVLQETFDPIEANELIQQHRCTTISGIFAAVKQIADAPNFDRDKCPDLRHLVVFPRNATQLDTYKKLGVQTASVAYGMTETTGCVVYVSDLSEESLACTGYTLPGVELELRHPDGTLVTPGTHGEIHVRGPSIMIGYFNKPEETAKVLTDGWLKTGDVGFVNHQGCLTYVSRLSDIYKCSGFNVSAAEVEALLEKHPAVGEVAVIGVPDHEKYEVGAAYVVLRPKAELTVAQMQAFCRGKIAAFKVPGHLRLVESLPKTTSGKIRKNELRSAFANE